MPDLIGAEQSAASGQQSVSPSQPAQPVQSSSSGMSSIFQYILIGVSIIVVVGLIVFLIYKKINSKVYDIGEQLELTRKENALLKDKLKQHEADKQAYVRHIDNLTNELDELSARNVQPYSSTLPMRVDSYDAPDPDAQPRKPQIVKDKEAIKAMVNKPRPTVQDEIDNINQEKQKHQEDDEEVTKNEISNLTHQNSNDDDNEVENIMSIIQSQ